MEDKTLMRYGGMVFWLSDGEVSVKLGDGMKGCGFDLDLDRGLDLSRGSSRVSSSSLRRATTPGL